MKEYSGRIYFLTYKKFLHRCCGFALVSMRICTQIRLWIRIRRPNYYGSGLMSFKWIRIHNTATFLYLKPYTSVQSGSAVITNQWIGTALLGTAWIMTKLNWFISCCFSCSLPRLGFSKYRYRYQYGARAFMCPDNINAEETDPSWCRRWPMPLLPHFGTYNLQQQKASKFKFLLQQKFGFLPKYLVSKLFWVWVSRISDRIHWNTIDWSVKMVILMPV